MQSLSSLSIQIADLSKDVKGKERMTTISTVQMATNNALRRDGNERISDAVQLREPETSSRVSAPTLQETLPTTELVSQDAQTASSEADAASVAAAAAAAATAAAAAAAAAATAAAAAAAAAPAAAASAAQTGVPGELSFGNIAAQLGGSSDNDFRLPRHQEKRQNAAQRKKERVVGSSGTDYDLVALPMRDYWDIHIGNMDGEKVDSAEKIKAFMNRRGVTPVDVWIVGKPEDSNATPLSTRRRVQAKVRVKTLDKDKCLDASFWPNGITVRSCKYERKTGSIR